MGRCGEEGVRSLSLHVRKCLLTRGSRDDDGRMTVISSGHLRLYHVHVAATVLRRRPVVTSLRRAASEARVQGECRAIQLMCQLVFHKGDHRSGTPAFLGPECCRAVRVQRGPRQR
jgi:hypothetical protein